MGVLDLAAMGNYGLTIGALEKYMQEKDKVQPFAGFSQKVTIKQDGLGKHNYKKTVHPNSWVDPDKTTLNVGSLYTTDGMGEIDPQFFYNNNYRDNYKADKGYWDLDYKEQDTLMYIRDWATQTGEIDNREKMIVENPMYYNEKVKDFRYHKKNCKCHTSKYKGKNFGKITTSAFDNLNI